MRKSKTGVKASMKQRARKGGVSKGLRGRTGPRAKPMSKRVKRQSYLEKKRELSYVPITARLRKMKTKK
tara:strand:+ start:636 stop:842 length:207 start_codon:yes stop_codon:yes gene_type:complete